MSHANISNQKISFIHIVQNIWVNIFNRSVLIFIVVFYVGAHFFMHTVFDSFYEFMLGNIVKESKKVGSHIALEYSSSADVQLDVEAILKLKHDFQIYKIKIFDKNGYVVYSTDQKDIGVKNKNDYFYNNVAKGENIYKVVQKNGKTMEKELSVLDVAEIYVPYMRNKEFHGAAEIYYDITEQKNSLQVLIHKIDHLFVIGMIILIITVLLMLYKNSYNELVKQSDDSKAKEMDVVLQHQSRLAAMGELVGNIAHQWRQPLSIITTAISGLRLKSEFDILTNDEVLQANNSIIKQANFLSTTIENFKIFFKSNHEQKFEFFIYQSIESAINIIHSTYEVNFISITTDLDSDVTYYGDNSLLSQVILKILANARDAYENYQVTNKMVSITLKNINNEAIIEIKDNAGGIRSDIIEKIFDPYFTTKHQKVGTGLGLYICMQIIQNHFNGHITVSNELNYDGLGALFVIRFPIIHMPLS